MEKGLGTRRNASHIRKGDGSELGLGLGLGLELGLRSGVRVRVRI